MFVVIEGEGRAPQHLRSEREKPGGPEHLQSERVTPFSPVIGRTLLSGKDGAAACVWSETEEGGG